MILGICHHIDVEVAEVSPKENKHKRRGGHQKIKGVMIPAITPTFSSTSRLTTSPEVPRDTSASHVPLGSHVIHPRAPLHTMPREPISRPRWVQLRELPPHLSTPDAPNEPGGSPDPWIDSTAMTEDLSILQGLLSRLPMSLWSAVPDMTDTDRH